MNKDFTIERIIKIILVLSALNVVFILALSFFVFQFIEMNRPVAGTISGVGGKTGEAVNFPVQPKIELPKVLYNLSGKITGIEKDAVIFNAAVLVKGSGGEIVGDAESRKANIGPVTVIKRLAFIKNSPVESVINFTDLKIGDYVEVISDQDISTAAEFQATRVTILP